LQVILDAIVVADLVPLEDLGTYDFEALSVSISATPLDETSVGATGIARI